MRAMPVSFPSRVLLTHLRHAKPARCDSAGLGERPPWNPPGRRWRLAGKPAGPIARAGLGERPPWNPWWPAARFLRHRAEALLVWGSDPPGTPGGLRPGSFVTGPGPCWSGGATPERQLAWGSSGSGP